MDLSDEWQAFRLELSDALRAESDPTVVACTATSLLGNFLNVDRCYIARLSRPQNRAWLECEFRRDDLERIAGEYRLSDFPDSIRGIETGSPIHHDVQRDPHLSALDKASLAAMQMGAYAVGVLRSGPTDVIWALVIGTREPRQWTSREFVMLEEAAERTWSATERARATAALRNSEDQYRSVFAAIDEGFCIIELLADDGKMADYRFLDVNPAFERHTGLTDVIGKLGSEVAGGTESYWIRLYEDIVRSGAMQRFENFHAGTGRWYDVHASRVGDTLSRRVCTVFKDITARKRADAVMRESEERFRQFANASSGALWIRNAKTLSMEYTSPAIAAIYGVTPEALLGDIKRWASLIVPEDRGGALTHIEQARLGDAVVHEFRIQRPSDDAFRWIKNTDFPLLDVDGRVQRIGGIAEDVTDAKLAVEHQRILLAELQHRVRNIMAIIRSIAARTAESAASVSDYAELLAGRLLTFARVQALLTRGANVGVGIVRIVQEELAAQAGNTNQYSLAGPDVILSPKSAEVLTLAVHELATNALKYGALASSAGRIAITWTVADNRGVPWLQFDWSETSETAPSPMPRRRGFGSELIEGRVPYELGGRGTLSITASGAQCRLEFPLEHGASVLETDAPQRATLFGGALDMSGAADLRGERILVADDDYYLANDTARALRSAGAYVLGPYASEDGARGDLDDAALTGAVVDINLGDGPSFELAASLRHEGIPFVFVTGYGEDGIPAEMSNVPRLQKPVDLRSVINTLASVLH